MLLSSYKVMCSAYHDHQRVAILTLQRLKITSFLRQLTLKSVGARCPDIRFQPVVGNLESPTSLNEELLTLDGRHALTCRAHARGKDRDAPFAACASVERVRTVTHEHTVHRSHRGVVTSKDARYHNRSNGACLSKALPWKGLGHASQIP